MGFSHNFIQFPWISAMTKNLHLSITLGLGLCVFRSGVRGFVRAGPNHFRNMHGIYMVIISLYLFNIKSDCKNSCQLPWVQINSLPMEAAKLLEFDLNCSLIELSHKLRRGWASSNHSQKNVDQWHRSSHSPGKRKLLARCDCDNTPPSVWKGRSRRWSLKNYLRSTMGKDRLTGVGIAIHVNKSTEVDPDDIVELYASKKERRIRILWF